jgi:hypothetical protein
MKKIELMEMEVTFEDLRWKKSDEIRDVDTWTTCIEALANTTNLEVTTKA